ncbi:Downstream Of DAF-16 (regulated by DAF-16) [Caenorhabditis elegans]|uniref:Downstream Of DAF-16 (Regulated by DAF-16) n=1 Tax=Caenorhabditis elegans TaxID=6239 RepID=O76438_CAEEL|nr:Downstream Of DAF-16 (regulated by DAF-16) [Caenorhabditis elegans]CCD65468.1 Downstream Of DAF-16 (regulated by DAF-16) [Caenorhabditis elegans]|eukprot:NP_503742.1 Downstream Of DAF-16 (regulated by DAF-16) [Caenorhabditis elegans]
MPSQQSIDIESAPIVTPPPYMDPANAQAKKKWARVRQESCSQMKPCAYCGAAPEAQKAMFPNEPVFMWPAQRPTNYIHQDSKQFIGYVLLIAVVIFLLFAACKYLP